MIKKKEKRGGRQENAGRHKKPYSRKKQQISLYFEGAIIDSFGGHDKIKEEIKQYINAKSGCSSAI